MQDRIKEHDRDIRLARTETSAVLEHANNTGHKPLWNEVKFIDHENFNVFNRSSYYVYVNFMIWFRRNGWATYKVLKHFQFVIWERYFTSRLTMLGLMLYFPA